MTQYGNSASYHQSRSFRENSAIPTVTLIRIVVSFKNFQTLAMTTSSSARIFPLPCSGMSDFFFKLGKFEDSDSTPSPAANTPKTETTFSRSSSSIGEPSVDNLTPKCDAFASLTPRETIKLSLNTRPEPRAPPPSPETRYEERGSILLRRLSHSLEPVKIIEVRLDTQGEGFSPCCKEMTESLARALGTDPVLSCTRTARCLVQGDSVLVPFRSS